MQQNEISEKSKLPLSLVITIIGAVVAFTFWQGVLYTDVQYLKQQNAQILVRLDELNNQDDLALN